MKNAYEAETIAFLEALAGEYAEETSVRRQWTSVTRDPWCERIEVLAESGALVAF